MRRRHVALLGAGRGARRACRCCTGGCGGRRAPSVAGLTEPGVTRRAVPGCPVPAVVGGVPVRGGMLPGPPVTRRPFSRRLVARRPASRRRASRRPAANELPPALEPAARHASRFLRSGLRDAHDRATTTRSERLVELGQRAADRLESVGGARLEAHGQCAATGRHGGAHLAERAGVQRDPHRARTARREPGRRQHLQELAGDAGQGLGIPGSTRDGRTNHSGPARLQCSGDRTLEGDDVLPNRARRLLEARSPWWSPDFACDG